MPYRNEPFAQDEFYHLYNRGIEKRVIFLDKEDYEHFGRLLYLCNTTRSITLRNVGEDFDRGEQIVAIGAYCLMPNHFHLLIKEITEKGVSIFMKKLLTAYSMYFNKKYERTGHLFEGVFKSKHLSTDIYLKYMYAYIHLNPAKLIDPKWKEKRSKSTKELLGYSMAYPYSSVQEYLGSDKKIYRKEIISAKNFPGYFLKVKDHVSELFEWLSFNMKIT